MLSPYMKNTSLTLFQKMLYTTDFGLRVLWYLKGLSRWWGKQRSSPHQEALNRIRAELMQAISSSGRPTYMGSLSSSRPGIRVSIYQTGKKKSSMRQLRVKSASLDGVGATGTLSLSNTVTATRPYMLTSQGRLLRKARRLRKAKSSGFKEIRVT